MVKDIILLCQIPRLITFSFDIESTDKTRSIVNGVGRALVKRKVLMFGLKEIYAINNEDIQNTYEDLYLS